MGPRKKATPRSTIDSPQAVALVLLGVALVSALAFLPVRLAGFVMDDVPIVQDNPVLRAGSIGTVFRVGYWGSVAGGEAGLYRPVTTLSFLLESGPSGVDPAGAHLVSLALHALTAAMLSFFLLRLGSGLLAAGVAGLLFGVHPVHVSVVSGLVGRAEILATLFILVALYLHTWTAPWPGSETAESPWTPRLAAWGAALAFFLAMGAKEAAITAPALLLCLDLLYRPPASQDRRGWIVDRLGAYAPTALATVVYLVLRTLATEALPGVPRVFQWQNPIVGYGGASRFFTALGLVARYLRLLVWPTRLSADYSGAAVIGEERSLFGALPLIGVLTLLALFAIAALPLFMALQRRSRDAVRPDGRLTARNLEVASVGATWFLVTYLVVSNLPTLIGVGMAERLLYLPSAGFCALAGVGCSWIASRGRLAERAVIAALAAVGLLFTVLSYSAAKDWHDEDSLWDAMVRSIPESPLGHHMIGLRLAKEGRLDEAMREFDAVLSTTPDSSSDLYEKALLFARRGDLASAEPLYRRSVHLDPYYAPAQADFGIVLHRLGKRDEAERRLRYAMRAFPGMEKPVSELADLLFETGGYSEAVPLYRKAVKLGRSDLSQRLSEAERRAAAP